MDGWGIWANHVWPINDLKVHNINSPYCWCKPYWDVDILVHNAMDKREEYERGRKPS